MQSLSMPLLLFMTLSACSAEDESSSAEESGLADATGDSIEGKASCLYTNRFTATYECKQYTGAEWTIATAQEDCDTSDGSFDATTPCSEAPSLGACLVDEGSQIETKIVFWGEDASACQETQRGCEVFAGGSFVPGSTCRLATDDSSTPPGGIGTNGNVYTEGPLECVSPVDDVPGLVDGDVCTRSMIGGCTEPGRKFEEYATCETVLTQRPYSPRPPAQLPASEEDPRLLDESYLQEISWVKQQVESCGCVCCHSERLTPAGAANWDIDAGPLWVDTFNNSGLAMGAGWVSSESLGAFPPEENNGFSREVAGLPTTDETRMLAFFENELEHRGLERSDFRETLPFGGPIYSQSLFVPSRCAEDQGVDASGTVKWSGGDARYVFVMENDAKNPGAPPNLDLPDGTLWKIGVASTAEPVSSGLSYGRPSEGASQRFPLNDEGASELVEGEEYYLYVQADVGIPITRCLFVAQ